MNIKYTYTPTVWSDRSTLYPYNYKMINNHDSTTGYYQDSSVTVTKDEGTIFVPGTPVNLYNLHKLDKAIYDMYMLLNQLRGDISSQTINLMDLNFELEMIKKSKLVGSNHNLNMYNLFDSNDIIILKGTYDSVNHRVTI
jgi:hypothetical protein